MPYTSDGQDAALYGAGLSNVATTLRAYDSTSTPNENGSGFSEVSGGGYAGISIGHSDWTAVTVGSHRGIQLADQTFTATGGSIANIAGVYLTDTGGNVLFWWARSSVLTLADGEYMKVDDAKVYFNTNG
jgi:hypothetical protein